MVGARSSGPSKAIDNNAATSFGSPPANGYVQWIIAARRHDQFSHPVPTVAGLKDSKEWCQPARNAFSLECERNGEPVEENVLA
jgi:hypothetical protein